VNIISRLSSLIIIPIFGLKFSPQTSISHGIKTPYTKTFVSSAEKLATGIPRTL